MMGVPQEEVERVILKLLSFGLFEAADFNSCLADFFCLVIIDGESRYMLWTGPISNTSVEVVQCEISVEFHAAEGNFKQCWNIGCDSQNNRTALKPKGLPLLMELQPVAALSYRQSLNLLASVATLNYQFRV
ncbi:hypothetical protein Tco_1563751 [Tanacetum coccineum]